MNLEPRHEKAGSILFEELEEVNEVLFISRGQCDVGFEVNKIKKWVLRFFNKTMVGAYNCTFSIRSVFCYKCNSECEGYSIRKSNWLNILNEFPDIASVIKSNVVSEYNKSIKFKMFKAKRDHLKKLSKRADFHKISVIIPNQAEQLDPREQNNDFSKMMLGQSSHESLIDQESSNISEIGQEIHNYQGRVEKLTSGISNIIKYIDEVGKENTEIEAELAEVYGEINKLKAEGY
uniref:Uncharacterized protein n=1 Tax=Strombidium inclinatum TaxID=197538 RepID=A0A7S3J0T5_9SPIT|mmetsp:Transcript_8272/g.12663  ORF Transcript_8272/g.12663 Transcript_8272/m.12663 type:complete len:234 (+) Transcript_8272:313-1014(+)